jgi:hypothetical protein
MLMPQAVNAAKRCNWPRKCNNRLLKDKINTSNNLTRTVIDKLQRTPTRLIDYVQTEKQLPISLSFYPNSKSASPKLTIFI